MISKPLNYQALPPKKWPSPASAPLDPLTPAQYVGYSAFFLLTVTLCAFSLIWWINAAMRL